MTNSLNLLACQINIPAMTTSTQRDLHLQSTASLITAQLNNTNTADQPIDIVVLPELSSLDYAAATFEQLATMAEPLNGPSFQCFSKLAQQHKVAVVFGFACALQPDEPHYGAHPYTICQAVIDADGKLIGHYHKLHLAHFGASSEKDYFSRGQQLCIFNLKGITIAPIICYDIRFPELCRRLTQHHGAQLLLHCGAYARDASFDSWHQFVVTRALENQTYLLSLNRAGKQFGASLFCPPWTDTKHPVTHFAEHDAQFQILQVQSQVIEQARAQYSLLNDALDHYDLPLT